MTSFQEVLRTGSLCGSGRSAAIRLSFDRPSTAPVPGAVTASQSIRWRWQRSSDCPSARWTLFARVRELSRRVRPSGFRRGLREQRFRLEHQQPSSREWSSVSFPVPAPMAASSRLPRRERLQWPERSRSRTGERPPVTWRKAWECFRQRRVPLFADLTWMPSFGRLQSCRLILFQQFEAKAILSGRSDQGQAYLRTQANSARQPIRAQRLRPVPLWTAKWCALDDRMALVTPGLHRDRDSRSPTGSPAASATVRRPHLLAKCFQGYSARGLAWRDPRSATR